jgi:hypothetical protein
MDLVPAVYIVQRSEQGIRELFKFAVTEKAEQVLMIYLSTRKNFKLFSLSTFWNDWYKRKL